MIYKITKISEAPTDIDPHDKPALEREFKNWYLAVDDKGNEVAVKNPIAWPSVERKPGIWYRVRVKPIEVGEALEDMRRQARRHG